MHSDHCAHNFFIFMVALKLEKDQKQSLLQPKQLDGKPPVQLAGDPHVQLEGRRRQPSRGLDGK